MSGFYDSYVDYIRDYWSSLTFSLPKSKGVQIALPHDFVSPSSQDGIFEGDQFYWDSYFIILGLLKQGFVDLAKGMVDNLVYLCDNFGFVPLRNRMYNLGISQPPFLSSMILEVFNVTNDKEWLSSVVESVKHELLYCEDSKGIHNVF